MIRDLCRATRPQNVLTFEIKQQERKDKDDDRRNSPTSHPHKDGSSCPRGAVMLTLLLWVLLLIVSWPLALLALFLYPVVWLLSLPFRLLGFSVKAVLDLVVAVITFPVRLLQGRAAVRSA